jgi:hypothetical protein
MLFQEALELLKHDETIQGIVLKDKHIIMDRGTEILYLSNGYNYYPEYEDIISDEWEIDE